MEELTLKGITQVLHILPPSSWWQYREEKKVSRSLLLPAGSSENLTHGSIAGRTLPHNSHSYKHWADYASRIKYPWLTVGYMQYYAFVEERQKVHCLNTLFSKVSFQPVPTLTIYCPAHSKCAVSALSSCFQQYWANCTLQIGYHLISVIFNLELFSFGPHLPLTPNLCWTSCDVDVAVISAAADQSIHHFLQFCEPRWAASKEDHWAGILLFLHPCKDAAKSSQSGLPRLPQWKLPQSCFLR